DALPLAARELARIALREVVEAESLQHFHRTVTRLGRRLAALRRRDRQIAEDRPVLEQLIVLKNDADHPRFDRLPFGSDLHLTRGGLHEAGEDAKERRLPHARRPEQR